MENFQPTHFIMQFNDAPQCKEPGKRDYIFCDARPIEEMYGSIIPESKYRSVHTVAIFKIKEKPCANRAIN